MYNLLWKINNTKDLLIISVHGSSQKTMLFFVRREVSLLRTNVGNSSCINDIDNLYCILKLSARDSCTDVFYSFTINVFL